MEDLTIDYKEITAIDFIPMLLHHKKMGNYKISGRIVITDDIMPGTINLEITNCYFVEEVDFRTNYIEKIFFVNTTFQKRLLLSGDNYNFIKIFSCKFSKYFTFKRVASKKIEIDECVIENSILTHIQEFSCDYFYFRKNLCENDILIKPNKIFQSIYIEGSEKNYLITYSGLDIADPLKELFLFTYSNYKTDYLIRSFKSEKLQVVGELKDSILSFNNCEINHGIIQNFINQGTLIFNYIKPLSENSVLVIKDSLLGKAQVNNTDFSKYKKIILSSSNILELVPVNIKWCVTGRLEAISVEISKENYRQLKIVATKNDDLESKLFFQRLEMKALMQIHKKSKSAFNDFIILKTNSWSNDFGLSWTKAFYWFLGSTVLSYVLIKIAIGEIYFNPNLILDDIGRFLIFINPIHQFDKVFNIDPLTQNTNGALMIDGLSKLFSAYIIYQFVASFRKYSLK